MSRRASVFAKQNPGKRRVRFPDEVIFENEIKEQDGHAVMNMLRRASVDIDIDRINSAGMEGVNRRLKSLCYCDFVFNFFCRLERSSPGRLGWQVQRLSRPHLARR